MPSTFTPIDNAVLAGLQKGDEGALELLFRGHYDALLEEAKSQLDEASAVPRVVETAILRAWDKHAEFQSSAELEKFLHQAVHEGAVREVSRRASVHRLESHETGSAHKSAAPTAVRLPTVDEAWAHLQSTLHVTPDAAKKAQQAGLSRHVAAEHMAAVGKKGSPLKTLAFLVAAGAGVATVLFVLFRDTPEKKATRMLAAADVHEIITKAGQLGSVILDDGSKASVGAASKVVVPKSFGDKVRAVRVIGTASFEVAPGQPLPFEVRLGETAVLATGTKFAVNFDSATHASLVKVVEGAVNVRNGESTRPLATGQSLAVSAKGEMSDPSPAQVDEALAWMEGRFVVADKTLRLTLELVRRWYGIAIIPDDGKLLERTVSVDAKLGENKEVIADLEATGKMRFAWKANAMTLFDSTESTKPKKKR